jgi:hypothetical protein
MLMTRPTRIVYTNSWRNMNARAFVSDFLNDLFEYNPESETWTDLTGPSSAVSPSPRRSHGFVGAGGRLYLFGGIRRTGVHLSHSISHIKLIGVRRRKESEREAEANRSGERANRSGERE